MCRSEGGDEPEPHAATARPVRGTSGHEQLAQELAVVVHVLGAQVHLEVADHVDEDEAEQHDAGDGHHPLLADRRPVELERPERPVLRRAVDDRRRCARPVLLRRCHLSLLRCPDPSSGAGSEPTRRSLRATEIGDTNLG